MGNNSSKATLESSQIKAKLSKPVLNFQITTPTMKAFLTKLPPKPMAIQDEPSLDTKLDSSEFLPENDQNLLNSPGQEAEGEGNVTEEQSVIEEIKIKWNNFIKMKKKNYLEEYVIIKEIGKGGFGTVSKVKAKFTGVVRAAKKIKKSALAKGQHEKLFQEMAIMINLDHPNIARLFQVYDYKSSYVLILQLCEGGELFKKIVTKTTNQTNAVSIMTQLLRALAYLHGKGIVHRDLKPQNILFEKGSDYLKLIDFGIAIHYNGKQPLTSRIGTPYYIAPEVLCKKYDEKCDLWSTGVILYMMLTYRPPFKGQSQLEVMQHIITDEPSFKHHSLNNVTGECLDFLKKLLTKNPEKRPSALQAYNHPWIQKYLSAAEQEKTNEDAIDNLSTFKFGNKLEAVVYTYIVSQILSSEEKNVLKKLFEQLDKNNDGVISTDEFKKALMAKKQISEERIKFLVRVIDTNSSGQIDFTEFIVAALEPEKLTSSHFEQAFSYFDIDHSGTITYDEIAAFLEDKENSQEEIRKIFKEVDQNSDGMISKEEFLNILTQRTRQRKEEKMKQKAKSSRLLKSKRTLAPETGGQFLSQNKESCKRLSG